MTPFDYIHTAAMVVPRAPPLMVKQCISRFPMQLESGSSGVAGSKECGREVGGLLMRIGAKVYVS